MRPNICWSHCLIARLWKGKPGTELRLVFFRFEEDFVLMPKKIRGVALLGLCARSGTGKTTLLKRLIARFSKDGLRVGVLKHAHHGFDVDKPGKDSYELRNAGARCTLVSSSTRFAVVRENMGEPEGSFRGMIDTMKMISPDLDLIMVEGFKKEIFTKIELHRKGLNNSLMCTEDPGIVAVASDDPSLDTHPVSLLDINDVGSIASYIQDNVLAMLSGR